MCRERTTELGVALSSWTHDHHMLPISNIQPRAAGTIPSHAGSQLPDPSLHASTWNSSREPPDLSSGVQGFPYGQVPGHSWLAGSCITPTLSHL